MPDHPRMIKYYEDLLEKHGDHWSALDWKSGDSQQLRFEVLSDIFVMAEKTANFSLLDVGCGFGDLYHYLSQKKVRCDYTGYDIAPRIIETAQHKYPKAGFEVKDILKDANPRQFDFVLCCGALNISFEEAPEHLTFIRSMLLRMFELCKIGVGVNFLSSQAIYYLPEGSERQPQYFYAKPEDILGFAKGMTSRFIVRHDYHPGDFTVYLFK
jgi:2-polyprenyl-3-methyl-5-hydroxy-6-metoxy-1,4-benzoquinol methylase